MITGSAAFEQILDAIRPDLRARGFQLLDTKEYPEAFGSRYATFGDGKRLLRLTWDGKERFFLLEGDPDPDPSPATGPVWLDLTLQRYDPARAGATWIGEIVEDVRSVLREFAD